MIAIARCKASMAVLVLLLAGGLAAQQAVLKLRIRAALVDQNLNIKPVPKLELELRTVGAPPGAQPVRVSTGFDGTAEIEISAGSYRVTTPHPVEFQSKTYAWDLEVTVGPREKSLELSNDNAKIAEAAAQPTANEPDLSAQFRQLRNCVVTVRSEFGHGTGFIVHPAGLVMTNQHVVGPSEFIAAQFDERRKVPATLLAADSAKDVAVLWINMSVLPEACVVTLAKGRGQQAVVVEGERVFTIGSPLSQQKILTTGVVSKVEPHRIVSDININPGNSGGPLFNRAGLVVGITTFSEQAEAGPGLSGIVRIEEAESVLTQARTKTTGASPPSASLLPVEPVEPYPFETISKTAAEQKFDRRPYMFGVGDYEVQIVTPLFVFRVEEEKAKGAEKERQKRARKRSGGEAPPAASDEVKDWQKSSEGYKPVIHILASPKLRETGGSVFLRALTKDATPAKLRFKTDFYRMRLLCGSTEVKPIHPGRIATRVDVRNVFVNATDATYRGFYVYPPDAISPNCRQVSLELYPEKGPTPPVVKVLDPKTVARVWSDFEPFRNSRGASSDNPRPAPK